MKTDRKKVSPGKRLRHRIEVSAFRVVAWLVPKFPRRFAQRMGRALGSLVYWLSPTLRSVSLENLDVAFGDTKSPAEKRRIARASLANVGATLLALFWSPRLSRERLDDFVELDAASLERVRAAKAQGRPVIFITLHHGDWELLGLATGFYGIPITVVQEAMRNAALEEIFARLRGVSGHRIVPNRFAGTTLLKTLKRGGNIALLIDLNATRTRGGVWLDFFGLPVFNNAAVGLLALHSDAAIVPGVAYPLPDGRTKIVYGPEIDYAPTDNAKTINQKALRFCEEVIRRSPEPWLWSYKRWKFRPTEERGNLPHYSRYWPPVVAEPGS